MAKKIKSYEITLAIGEVLETYSVETKRAIIEAQDEVAKETRDRLRQESPKSKNGGDYAKGWAIKRSRKGGGRSTTVYNKDKPQLTHLLENSHVIRNGVGTWGRTGPGRGQIVHIAPVEAWSIEEYEKRVKEAIEK